MDNNYNPNNNPDVLDLTDLIVDLATTPCVFADVNSTCSTDVGDPLCNPCLARHLVTSIPVVNFN